MPPEFQVWEFLNFLLCYAYAIVCNFKVDDLVDFKILFFSSKQMWWGYSLRFNTYFLCEVSLSNPTVLVQITRRW